jgi:hypothetical protein
MAHLIQTFFLPSGHLSWHLIREEAIPVFLPYSCPFPWAIPDPPLQFSSWWCRLCMKWLFPAYSPSLEFAAEVKLKKKNHPPTLLWPEGAEQWCEQFNSLIKPVLLRLSVRARLKYGEAAGAPHSCRACCCSGPVWQCLFPLLSCCNSLSLFGWHFVISPCSNDGNMS